MTMLDAILGMCFRWFTGGKSEYRERTYGDFMPGDWSSDEKPKKKHDIASQFDAFVKAHTR